MRPSEGPGARNTTSLSKLMPPRRRHGSGPIMASDHVSAGPNDGDPLRSESTGGRCVTPTPCENTWLRDTWIQVHPLIHRFLGDWMQNRALSVAKAWPDNQPWSDTLEAMPATFRYWIRQSPLLRSICARVFSSEFNALGRTRINWWTWPLPSRCVPSRATLP